MQVDKWRFQEVLQRLDLLQSRAQVDAAMADFAHLSSPSLVSYEDFCHLLETSARGVGAASAVGGMRGARDSHEDGEALSQANVDRWYAREASPKQRREFSSLYDSLRAFKAAHSDRGSREFASGSFQGREVPITLDEGSYYDGGNSGGLFPPKPSDSLSFRSSGALRPPLGSGRYSRERDSWERDTYARDGGSRSPTREVHHSGRSSPVAPRTSPSKVSSRMWGTTTSLEEKGRPPRMEDGLWCCAVCLYTENSANAAKCAICDSANYTKRKEFTVKEQCRNCTFLNGALATECEMCGTRMT